MTTSHAWLVLLAAGGLGCGGGGQPPNVYGVDAGPDPAGAVDATPVRFIVMGDSGTGTARQRAVGAAVAQLCAAEGCDFVILLGDNLYPDGANDVTDPVWQTDFEQPYAGIDVPFYAILGNHDFGSNGMDWEREDVEVAYSAYSTRWHMPAPFYTLRRGPVGFLMLDTNRLLWNRTDDGDQRGWWPSAQAELAGSPWIIATGHHPYRSNGTHGNMGSYGGGTDSIAAENAGTDIKAFFDQYVCGQVDLYAAGHDHDREWLDAPEACGGTELVVSGAGGTAAHFERNETPFFWHDDTKAGFLYVVADATSLRGRFVDEDGVTAFERDLSK
jgi:tartrate-resistant acid phosphatase type 5